MLKDSRCGAAGARAGAERDTCLGRHGSAPSRAGRRHTWDEPSASNLDRNRRQESRSGGEDADTHAHSTLSAEATEVKVFYPFHPLRGSTLQIQRRPKRGDGAASVADRMGKRLKIPMWMLSPSSAEIRISERAVLSKEALLSLSSVLAIRTRRDHDNLQPIAVDVCEGGNHGAAAELLGLIREAQRCPVNAMVRAELVGLMAHILVRCLTEGGRLDDELLYSPKITPEHWLAKRSSLPPIERQAGSTEPGESAAPVEMAERIRGLGWRQVEVIDSDLGTSAAWSARREGFERVLSSVALGEVGIVVSREASRLSRTDKDWCRLLKVARSLGHSSQTNNRFMI